MRLIVAIALCFTLLTTASCGGLQTIKDNPTLNRSVVAISQLGIPTLSWLKATMDTSFDSRCASGEVSPKACVAYSIFSHLMQNVLTTAINSLQNYMSKPDELNLAILQTSQTSLTETIAKADILYKDPQLAE